MIYRNLAKVEVVGSNPIARSIFSMTYPPLLAALSSLAITRGDFRLVIEVRANRGYRGHFKVVQNPIQAPRVVLVLPYVQAN